ncbi:MAG: FixH family protein [Pseudomonadota bacterium]
MRLAKAIFAPKEFTGRHMFGVLALFFGTIITVNLFLAYSAGSTWTGLVVKNTYVESQKFNERTEAFKKQAAMGWQYDVAYDDEELSVSLLDSFSDPIKNAIVVTEIGRPVQEGEDQILQMTEAGNRYSATAELGPGLWRARIKVIGPLGEQWQRTMRFSIFSDGRLVPESS